MPRPDRLVPLRRPILMLALAALADAHQPTESSTVARLEDGRLEVAVTISALLVGDMGDVEPVEKLSVAHFDSYRPELTRRARDF